MGREDELILLTGATGYVGGRLLRALEARGRRVRCMSRRPEQLRLGSPPRTARHGQARRARAPPGPLAWAADRAARVGRDHDRGTHARSGVDRKSLVPTLEKVAILVVAEVEPLRVRSLQPFHAGHEVGLWCLQEQVVVVGHQHPRVQDPTCPLGRVVQCLQPQAAVTVVEHNRFALVAASHDVIDGPGELDSRFSRHGIPST